MLVIWEDGVEEGPHGCKLREIPGGDWDDQTWISMDGRTFQRTFDPLCDAWAWSKERQIHIDNDSALQVDLYSGAKRRRTRLARAIALAWLHCPRRGSHAIAREAVDATSISWQCAGTLADFSVGANKDWVETSPPETGSWVPMLYTWVNANGDVVERIDPLQSVEYMVHPQGWVRSLFSRSVTQGHMTPGGERWVAVHGRGLACVQTVVERSCYDRPPPFQPLRLSQSTARTLQAMRERKTFQQIREEEGVLPPTLWARLLMLARTTHWDDAKMLWGLCPKDVRAFLRRGDLVEEDGIAAMLRSIRGVVDDTCPILHTDDGDAYGMLRVGWALIRRERLRERTEEKAEKV